MATAGKRVAERVLIAVAVVVALGVIAAAWYVNDYYHADGAALAVVVDENGMADGIEIRQLEGGDLAFVPEHPKAGLVFYPGAKVQPEAYAPLMQKLAEKGVLCVLLKPLLNLAILDIGAADGAIDQFPQVERWLIAGHSMGGVAAADYASRHGDQFEGIVFLASYPSVDLSSYDGTALLVVGSNDNVLKRKNYESARPKLPASSHEVVIDGGNHAYFGNYGQQAGDGEASITRENQQAQTADTVAELALAA